MARSIRNRWKGYQRRMSVEHCFTLSVAAMIGRERIADGRVVVNPPPLLATCPGIDRVVPATDPLPPFDCYLPMLNLPAAFGLPPAAPLPPVPYLTPPADRVAFWKRELGGDAGLRVGVVWQGSRKHPGDRERSVPLARFAPLAAVPGVRLYSLQKGPGSEQLADPAAAGMSVTDLGAKTGAGMEDAAAAVLALDVVVAVDTAVAHLAGAVGVPVWVAVPFAADWRWGQAGDNTPWYPTMRLFRQPAPGGWDDVFARLAAALADAARAKAAAAAPATD